MISSAETSLDSFYLTDDDLLNSPSLKDGIDQETEFWLRFYGCDLIVEACIYLRLRQAVAATAQVLFHRFFCKKSMKAFNVKRVASASVFLAAKLEEDVKKYRDVINTFHRLERRREGKSLDFVEQKQMEILRAELFRIEKHMLREFGFIAQVEHPHKLVLMFKDLLKLKENDLMQEAWNLVNDSLRTTLCVRFPTEVIACGCIYMAARKLQRPLPESPGAEGDAGPWWECFNVKEDDILEVARVLTALYKLPKPHYIHVGKELAGSTPTRQGQQAQQQPSQPPPAADGAAAAAGGGGMSRSTTPMPPGVAESVGAAGAAAVQQSAGGGTPSVAAGGDTAATGGAPAAAAAAAAAAPAPSLGLGPSRLSTTSLAAAAAAGGDRSRPADGDKGDRGRRDRRRSRSRSASRSRSRSRSRDRDRDRDRRDGRDRDRDRGGGYERRSAKGDRRDTYGGPAGGSRDRERTRDHPYRR